jgi:hypothetical protein
MHLINRNRATRLLGAVLLAHVVLGASSGSAHDYLAESFFFGDFDEYNRRSDSITLGLGNAVAHNIAVQTIDPWPAYVGKSRIDVDGERIMKGVTRYKENKSIPPRGLATESITKERNSQNSASAGN